MASAAWGAQDQPMASTGDDELTRFLDMSGMSNMADALHFDFHAFHDAASQSQPIMAPARHPPDTVMADSGPGPGPSAIGARTDGLLQHHPPPPQQQQQLSQPSQPPAMTSAALPVQMMAPSAPTDAISNIDAQIQYLQQQRFQQQQRQLHEQRGTFFSSHRHSVPPTPQSLDMAPAAAQLYSPAEHAPRQPIYDRRYHQSMAEQQDMAFTPLVSPAVTPLDPHFSMESAFAVPGAYFSPLTSPALHAQNDTSSSYDHSTHSNNSPIEMDLEAPAMAPAMAPAAAANHDLSKKARKNNAVKTRGKASIKSSPIAKPLRRKPGPSPAIVSQVLSEMDERRVRSGDPVLLPLPATSTDGSEEDASVSPENLTDMPPPPVPNRRSTSKSPYIRPQNASAQQPEARPRNDEEEEEQKEMDDEEDWRRRQRRQQQQQQQQQHQHQHPQQPHPATPASLMKLPASKPTRTPCTGSQEQNMVTDNIECLQLPESLANARPLAPINTSLASTCPRVEPSSAKGSSTVQPPLPSPGLRSSGTASAGQSPQLRPGSSGPSTKKTPQLAARNGRKPSNGSVHASPALLPRISPNIKPLLPGTPGMSAEDTASRLLMSKSNYQNILEGNTVPGVSYPSELSTNLTSKRTSHKIAEQGRRNRINSALQIMAGLLPDQDKAEVGDEAERKDAKQQGCVPNSKASVVENAIVHMKRLQRENVDLKLEVDDLKSQLERLQGPPMT